MELRVLCFTETSRVATVILLCSRACYKGALRARRKVREKGRLKSPVSFPQRGTHAGRDGEHFVPLY